MLQTKNVAPYEVFRAFMHIYEVLWLEFHYDYVFAYMSYKNRTLALSKLILN